MAEDPEKREEEKFEFTAEGEALGYIGMDQAQVRAMQVATETPGDYGSAYSGIPMAFEAASDYETEDHYVITLSLRPQGDFSGRPGQEQFFIEKEGGVAHRQVLALPRPGRRFPVIPIAIGLAVAGAVAVIAVLAVGGLGRGDDSQPGPAASLPTATPIPFTQTPPPAPTEVPAVDQPSEGTPKPTLTVRPETEPTSDGPTGAEGGGIGPGSPEGSAPPESFLSSNPTSPADGTRLDTRQPTLCWSHFPVAVGFRINYSLDPRFPQIGNLTRGIQNIPPDINCFSLPEELPESVKVYWRVTTLISRDPPRSVTGSTTSFVTGGALPLLASPRLIEPLEYAELSPPLRLEWDNSNRTSEFEIVLGAGPGHFNIIYAYNTTEPALTLTPEMVEQLSRDKLAYWAVRSLEPAGRSSKFSEFRPMFLRTDEQTAIASTEGRYVTVPVEGTTLEVELAGLDGVVRLGGIPFSISKPFVTQSSLSPTAPSEVVVVTNVTRPTKVHVLVGLQNSWEGLYNKVVGEIVALFDDANVGHGLTAGVNVREWALDNLHSTTLNTLPPNSPSQVWEGETSEGRKPIVLDLVTLTIPRDVTFQNLREIKIVDDSAPRHGLLDPGIVVFAVTVEREQ